MKKIYRPFIKGTNWALAGLLGFLGFSACDNKGEGPTEMYGSPWRIHTIKGAVVDDETGKPIEGIEVKLAIPDDILREANVNYQESWKAITNSEGEYKLSNTDFYLIEKERLPVAFNDIDGEENGSYKSDTIYVDITKGELIPDVPDEMWFEGEFITTADFKMEKESTSE